MSTSAADDERRTFTLILLESSLYGGFFVLYAISTILLYQRRQLLESQARNGFGGFGAGAAVDSGDKERLRTMRFWEVTGVIMFLIVTVHYMLTWVIFIGEPPEMTARLIQFARTMMAEVTLLVGDLIIIHRLWIVGGRSKRLIAFPLLALTSFLAFAIPLSWEYYLVYAVKPLTLLLRQNYWIMGVVVSTLSAARKFGGGQLMHVINIMVESAAIYSLWMVTTVGLVAVGHPLYITFYDIATELYGVSTMLISVRVGLGWATGDSGRTMDVESEYGRVSGWRPATISIQVPGNTGNNPGESSPASTKKD
ncbi:hypothetical protein NP233_g11168 [Leucocoprinus birnbaumii]|uniref:Uncharacterized protein n=1 Tax=Leucocoprinus birnbaumii TaxID=56174 RepID=A0AAD5VH19_9AGAR|nr:hypothetical protein NP233_g11168 [Leucocoprinus birnbaumii]